MFAVDPKVQVIPKQDDLHQIFNILSIFFNIADWFLHLVNYVVILAFQLKGSLPGKEFVKSGHLLMDLNFHAQYTMGYGGFHDKIIYTQFNFFLSLTCHYTGNRLT